MEETNRCCTIRLPAISLASAPVCPPHHTPPGRQSRSLTATPASFPVISDSARLQAHCTQIIPRLNPLHPPLVPKRTVSLETLAVHHHNHQRTLILQRREHYKNHQTWRKPFYGSCSERDECRKDLLEQLKRQMEEKCDALELQLAAKAAEAQFLRQSDHLALSGDREQRLRHKKAMTAYRDENKKLMEQRWRDRALTRSREALEERELLGLNPVNWSGTLK